MMDIVMNKSHNIFKTNYFIDYQNTQSFLKIQKMLYFKVLVSLMQFLSKSKNKL